MNISSFSNENYDIVEWINEYFQSVEEKDHYKKIHNTIAKLHVIMQEVYDSLNILCLNSSQPIINVHKELLKISQEVTSIENECREFNFKFDDEVNNKFDDVVLTKILKLHRAKSSLKSIKKVIEETQHWKLLIVQCNTAMDNNDIVELIEKYSKLKQIMYLLNNSSKNQEETLEISTTLFKIENFIKNQLVDWINQTNEVQCKLLFSEMTKFSYQTWFFETLLEIRSKTIISSFENDFNNNNNNSDKNNNNNNINNNKDNNNYNYKNKNIDIQNFIQKLSEFSVETDKTEINYVKKLFDFRIEHIINYLQQLHNKLIVEITNKISDIFLNIDNSHEYVAILSFIDEKIKNQNQSLKDQTSVEKLPNLFESLSINLLKDNSHYSTSFLHKMAIEQHKKLKINCVADKPSFDHFNFDVLTLELDHFMQEITFIFKNVIKFELLDITSFDTLWSAVKECLETLVKILNKSQTNLKLDEPFSTFFNFYFTIISIIGKFLKVFNIDYFDIKLSISNSDIYNSNSQEIFQIIKIETVKWHDALFNEIKLMLSKYLEYNFSILFNNWIQFYQMNDKTDLSVETPSNVVLMLAESIFDVPRQLELFSNKNPHLQADICWFKCHSNDELNGEFDFENWKYSFLKNFIKEIHQIMLVRTSSFNFKHETTLNFYNLDHEYLMDIYNDINEDYMDNP